METSAGEKPANDGDPDESIDPGDSKYVKNFIPIRNKDENLIDKNLSC